MINHENSSPTDEIEPAREITPDFLLRLKQLGDAGLRAAVATLKGEKA